MKHSSLSKSRPLPFALRAISFWLACAEALIPVSNQLLAAAAPSVGVTSAAAANSSDSQALPSRPQVEAFRADGPAPGPGPSFSPEPTDSEFFQAVMLG